MKIDLKIAILLIVFCLLIPVFGSNYHLTFLMQLFMMIALAQSWNLISGMTGYVSFGHSAFFGIGAYAGALLLIADMPWIIAIAGGTGLALFIALPIGLLTLRLRGPYFAIAMLGLNEVCRIIASLWVDVTEGGNGLVLAPELLPSLSHNYFIMFSLAVLATVLIGFIHQHRFGLELRAIRNDEDAAEMIGVNTTFNKVLAFVISATLPGAVGVVYAMFTSYIDPNSLFDPALNIQMIVMVLLGGSGTVWGPVIGATIVMILREVFWASFPAIHLALLGILLILIILYLPQGILSLTQRRKRIRPEMNEQNEQEF